MYFKLSVASLWYSHTAFLRCLSCGVLCLFPVHSQKPLLTVSFTSGDVSLMNNYDDLTPIVIHTGLKGVWASHHLCTSKCSSFVSHSAVNYLQIMSSRMLYFQFIVNSVCICYGLFHYKSFCVCLLCCRCGGPVVLTG